MKSAITDLIHYLENSPTAWNAVETTRQKLLKEDYTELHENESWNLEPSKKYFTTRNNSSLIAFSLPSKQIEEARIIGAHTDSPGLKLKPHGHFTYKNANLLSPEVYGSPTISSFINRRLGLAGRIIVRDKKGLEQEHVINISKPIGIIAPVAVHLDKEQTEKLIINFQKHLPAIIGLSGEKKEDPHFLEKFIKEEAGISFEELLGSELFLTPLDLPMVIGFDQSMISAGRLDNLLGSHASLLALLAQKNPHPFRVNVVALWDNEEVGSETTQGAVSTFLENIFTRIFEKFNLNQEKRQIFFQKSFLVSNDVAHGIHHNYSELHEPLHQPVLDKGPTIKMNAQQRYATNAKGEALITRIGKDHGIPLQHFVTRSDKGCGTTIGPIVGARLGLNTVDIGAPILSMHAFPELGSINDHHLMIKLLTKLFEE